MLDLELAVQEFFAYLNVANLEIYNEFSLQHEFGIYLRSRFPQDKLKVQFERPASFFGIAPAQLAKKEIDISVFETPQKPEIAVELKFPRNGRYPESMFDACCDLAFLENLVAGGFGTGLFVMVVDDHLFYEGPDEEGI